MTQYMINGIKMKQYGITVPMLSEELHVGKSTLYNCMDTGQTQTRFKKGSIIYKALINSNYKYLLSPASQSDAKEIFTNRDISTLTVNYDNRPMFEIVRWMATLGYSLDQINDKLKEDGYELDFNNRLDIECGYYYGRMGFARRRYDIKTREEYTEYCKKQKDVHKHDPIELIQQLAKSGATIEEISDKLKVKVVDFLNTYEYITAYTKTMNGVK